MSVSSATSRLPFSLEDLRELRKLNKDLSAVEATPVKATGNLSDTKVKEKSYAEWAASAEKVLTFFKSHKVSSPEEKKELSHFEKELTKEERSSGKRVDKISLKHELAELEEQLVALKCRARLENTPKVETGKLVEVLLAYRKNVEIFRDIANSADTPSFSEAQLQQIRKTCEEFPLFAQLLIDRHKGKNLSELKKEDFDDLTASFVKWALRAGTGRHEKGNNVDVFVKMPMRTKDLVKVNIDKRIGSISHGEGLEIRQKDGLEVLSLKIDGTYHNIMKGHEQDRILLSNPMDKSARKVEVTLQEIFNGFKEKTYGYGEFDWFHETGVTLWNAIELGSWNPDLNDGAGGYSQIDPENPLCLESMPVTKVIDKEEFARLYEGQTLPKEGEWGFAMRATRRHLNLNIGQTHGFFSLYQPTGDGKYRVYSMSLQSKSFPIGIKAQLATVANTCDAGMHYPDESDVSPHREHAMKLYRVSEDDVRNLFIPRFQKAIRRAQAETLYFQPQGKNCAYNAHGFFDETIGSILYGKVKELAKANLSHSPTELKEIFSKAFKTFDEGMLEKLVDDLLAQLISKGDMKGIETLFNASIELLAKTLFKDHPDAIEALSKIGVAAQESLVNVQNDQELAFAMKHLILDAIHSIQHYRVYLFDADFDSGLEYIIGFINSIPWKWLRDFVGTIIMFLLFLSWRTKTIVKKRIIDGVEVVFEKKISLWNTTQLERKHEFYLPASMWKWGEKQEAWKKIMPLRINEAREQLDIAMGAKGKSPRLSLRDIAPMVSSSASG